MVTTSAARPAAAQAVEDRMFRALFWLRIVLVANMLGLNWIRRDNFVHPTAGVVVVLAICAWTAVMLWAYADRRRRVPLLLVADLAIGALAILVSPLLKGEGLNATVPGFWVMAVVLEWGVRWRWVGGLFAATVISLADLSIRLPDVTQTNYANVFLLMIGGPIVGYLCGSLQQMAAQRDAAEREAAAAQERARLARAVHDGVLQVLALVQRRGAELGGEAAELGRLAGEQEARLRTLIREQDTAEHSSETDDLAVALEKLAGPSTTVATPGHAVLLPARTVTELVAVVRACLDNIERHVGEGAPAWVLLEALPDAVVVTVRDEGPGIPDGRLAQAERDGRLGVAQSIRGRMHDLGGTAELATGSFGTEWEFTVPRA